MERYSHALELLDAYDHQNMTRPKGNEATYILTYEECRRVIDSMQFADSSSLFAMKRMNLSKGALEQSIKVLEEWIFILLWKRRRKIYYILSRKIIVLRMEING